MKPLFARFIPAMVSEQPISAAEDARVWRALTGLSLLEAGGAVDDEEKQEDEAERRSDTAISMGVRSERRIAVPERMWRGRRKRGARARWSW